MEHKYPTLPGKLSGATPNGEAAKSTPASQPDPAGSSLLRLSECPGPSAGSPWRSGLGPPGHCLAPLCPPLQLTAGEHWERVDGALELLGVVPHPGMMAASLGMLFTSVNPLDNQKNRVCATLSFHLQFLHLPFSLFYS